VQTGTGKSTVIANIVTTRLLPGKRVLICTSSNKAIASLTDKLKRNPQDRSKILAFGRRAEPSVAPFLLEEQLKVVLGGFLEAISLAERLRDTCQSLTVTDINKLERLWGGLDWIPTDKEQQAASYLSSIRGEFCMENKPLRGKKHEAALNHLTQFAALCITWRPEFLQAEAEKIWDQTKYIVCTTSTASKLPRSLCSIKLSSFNCEVSLTKELEECAALEKADIDYIVLDEAGAMHELDVLGTLLCGARSVVFVGDHLQLPPAVSLTFNKLNDNDPFKKDDVAYGVSTMERLTSVLSPSHIFKLKEQYRMPRNLCELVSELWYKGTLRTAPSKIETEKMTVIFKPVQGKEEREGHSFVNHDEIHQVVRYVCKLLGQGKDIKDIVVITFYKAQREAMKRIAATSELYLHYRPKLVELNVATVDSMQGQERDHVILSCVRSGESPGFTKDKQRMNVAMSRAKQSLTVFGCPGTLMRSRQWRKFLDKAAEIGNREAKKETLLLPPTAPKKLTKKKPAAPKPSAPKPLAAPSVTTQKPGHEKSDPQEKPGAPEKPLVRTLSCPKCKEDKPVQKFMFRDYHCRDCRKEQRTPK